MSNLSNLKIAKEARIDEKGRGWFSLKAVAQLSGISVKELIDSRNKKGSHQRIGLLYWLLDLTFEEIPQSLKAFWGFDFTKKKPNQSVEEIEIPDVLVAAILSYYAHEHWEEKEQAKKSLMAFSSIGLRDSIEYLITQKMTEKNSDIELFLEEFRQQMNSRKQKILEANKLTKAICEIMENPSSTRIAEPHLKSSNKPQINTLTNQESLPLREPRKSSRKKH